jgi:hypothetical protein
MNRKQLKHIQEGFLQYVSQTYTSFTSYFIGLHMTIDSWRGGWDTDGRRLPLSIYCTMDRLDEDWGGVEDPLPEVCCDHPQASLRCGSIVNLAFNLATAGTPSTTTSSSKSQGQGVLRFWGRIRMLWFWCDRLDWGENHV